MEEDSIDEVAKKLQEKLLKGTGEGGVKVYATIGFYKSLLTHPEFRKFIEEKNEEILKCLK